MNDPDRVEFESRFSKPPFEWNFKRRGEESAWPGSYLKLEQEYAWQGFKMALERERGKECGCRDFRNTEPPPHRPSRDIMFDTRPRDE